MHRYKPHRAVAWFSAVCFVAAVWNICSAQSPSVTEDHKSATTASDIAYFQSDEFAVDLCKAGSMPWKEYSKIWDPKPSQDNYKAMEPKSLTWLLVGTAPRDAKKGDPRLDEFRSDGSTANVPESLYVRDEKNPTADPIAVSMPQAKFILKTTMVVNGDRADGMISFRAPDAYRGRVEVTCERKSGKWTFVEFRLPAYKKKTTLNAKGEWEPSDIK